VATLPVSAVSFDFFNTLVTHRDGLGRGARVMEYFRSQGWASSPWAHDALYDVFAKHGHEFLPEASEDTHRAYCRRVARTLFRRLNVQAEPAMADAHAVELWSILGPAHLVVFPDVDEALRQLRADGYRLVLISNWQCGLGRFCEALGLAPHFEAVVASAEVGVAKPDARIFSTACERLSVLPAQVLHVGDSQVDDVEGARRAGLHACLLDRDAGGRHAAGRASTLLEVVALLS